MNLRVVAPVFALVSGCAFMGQPLTDDVDELIAIANYRMEELGRPTGARNVLRQALPLAEKEGSPVQLALVHNNLGRTFVRERIDPEFDPDGRVRKENWARAEEHYLTSLQIARTNGLRWETLQAYYNLGNLFHVKGDVLKACEYLVKCADVYTDLIKNPTPPPTGANQTNLDMVGPRLQFYTKELGCDVAV
jgi:tetratricopeptide (TPR) repeat protein